MESSGRWEGERGENKEGDLGKEIRRALESLKRKKTVDLDEIQVEVWKYRGEEVFVR